MSTALTDEASSSQPASDNDKAASGNSYGVALKSTVSIGGASLINVALQVVRGKCNALILGPEGVGLIATYTVLTGLCTAVAGMGLSNSGVREIAEASGSGDQQRIARAATALRRASLVLGVLGAAAMALLSPWISRWSFGDDSHTWPIVLLSVTVLFATVSAGQTALIQGLRRVGGLARMNIIGAALTTVVSIPVIWWLGTQGIALFMLVVAGCGILTSWWYARKTEVPRVRLSASQTAAECRPMFRLGLSLMVSGVLAGATAYLIRVVVVRQLGVEASGHYQAAYALSGMYIGFVLNAMAADYYPRLAAVSQDASAMCRFVSEQAVVSLLLAVPGILATLTVAPFIIVAFYSSEFRPAVQVLQWQMLGVLLRVISWPLAYAIIAAGAARTYFVTEVLFNLLHVLLIWSGIALFGLAGTGIAFFGLYAAYWAGVYVALRYLTGFRYSRAAVVLLCWAVLGTAVVFIASACLSGWRILAFGLPITVVAMWRCTKQIAVLAPSSPLARWLIGPKASDR